MKYILDELVKNKIIAIVRNVRSADIIRTAQALKDGGINCLEVTFDQSSSEGYVETIKSLNLLRKNFGNSLLIGAGTVLTANTVDEAADAGARYIISPNCDATVIRRTKERQMISIPGAFTPSEVISAHTFGADIVKLFPAGHFGIEYLKAVRAPLSHIPLMVVGGITSENIRSFLTAGAIGAGVGGKLVDVKTIAIGEFNKLTQTAQLYISAITEKK